MKRVFIAVDISEEVRRVAAARMDELRRKFRDVRVSWVRPENMHITVKFLSDLSNEQVAALSSALRNVANQISPFEASLSAPIAFGRKALVIEVRDSSESFAELGSFLDADCENLGVVRENRPFRPHITIGRIRSQKGIQPLIAEHRKSIIKPVEFDVNAIVIYESTILRTGSVYTKLASFPLSGVG